MRTDFVLVSPPKIRSLTLVSNSLYSAKHSVLKRTTLLSSEMRSLGFFLVVTVISALIDSTSGSPVKRSADAKPTSLSSSASRNLTGCRFHCSGSEQSRIIKCFDEGKEYRLTKVPHSANRCCNPYSREEQSPRSVKDGLRCAPDGVYIEKDKCKVFSSRPLLASNKAKVVQFDSKEFAPGLGGVICGKMKNKKIQCWNCSEGNFSRLPTHNVSESVLDKMKLEKDSGRCNLYTSELASHNNHTSSDVHLRAEVPLHNDSCFCTEYFKRIRCYKCHKGSLRRLKGPPSDNSMPTCVFVKAFFPAQG